MPFNLWVTTSDVQHALIEVDADDSAKFSADQIDAAGDKAGAAGNIKNSIAVLAFCRQNQLVGPCPHDLTGNRAYALGASPLS